MKLKALSMQGFKSFADRTQIDFMPGITGIVGPNGSGKSNIIEAVRWVMGEQSAKGLRGDKMADVIFGGTKTRAPLNRAEVRLVLDNHDHYLKSDFTEIEIKRSLYRNGDSKYQLNGHQVRLRDIQDLFIDSGLGHESFSIISQGRVEHIFNAKPEERRAIIEEVAGVYKYKQNKNQAGKKLTDVKANLDRVQDILFELSNRLEPLAEQSAQAKDYRDQKAAYNQLDQQRLQVELTMEHAELATLSKELASKQAELEQWQAKALTTQQTLVSQKQALQALRAQQQQQQATLLETTQAVEALAGELKLQKEREHNQVRLVQTTQAQLKEQQQAQVTLEAQVQVAKQALQAAKASVTDLKAQVEALLNSAEHTQLSQLKQNLETKRTAVVDALEMLTTAKNNQRFAQQENQRVDAQSNRYAKRQAELKQQLAQLNAQLETVTTELNEAQADLTTAQTELAEQQAAGQAAETTYQKLRQDWYVQLQEQQQIQARLQSLQRLNEQYDGYYQGVKQLMQQRQKFSGIQGVVAELIQVDAKYQLAIETALGAGLQQVVVDQPATAKQAIQYLSQHHLGRVTFLPLTTIKARHLAADIYALAEGQPGFLGTAAALVDMAPAYQVVKQHLLATTLVADNLDHATDMAKHLKQRARIVTLDGQIINAGGSMTGGAGRHQQQGLLAQKHELETLMEQLPPLSQAVQALEQAVKEQQTTLQHKTEQFGLQQQKVSDLNETFQAKQVTVTSLKQQIMQLEKSQKSLAYDMQAAGINTTAKTGDVQADLKQAQQHYDQANADLNQTQAQIDQLDQQLAQSDEQLIQTRLALKTAEADQVHLTEKVDSAKHALAENQQIQTQLQQQLVDLQANRQDVQARLQKESAKKIDQQQQVTQALETMADQLKQVQAHVEKLEQQATSAQEYKQHCLQAIQTMSNQQSRLQAQVEQQQMQLDERYHTTYQPQAEQVLDQLDAIKDQLKLLKRGLDDIGEVNLGAIAEYEEVKTRYDFLQQQKQDLLDAHDNLSTTMSEMDDEVKTRFKTTFDAVNEHFEQIFVKMFGGGQAKLILTDDTDLLMTGVDIKAQPPGKKFQQMSLLSGGEKALTAISLLFAILAVKPVPFVVLDETEAALDEANVDRFAHYLQTIDQQTQFIVITHRQGTMQACDILYGVTMQEPGISTMVSVNLKQALNERG